MGIPASRRQRVRVVRHRRPFPDAPADRRSLRSPVCASPTARRSKRRMPDRSMRSLSSAPKSGPPTPRPTLATPCTRISRRARLSAVFAPRTVPLARAGLFEGRAHTSNGRDWLLKATGGYDGSGGYRDVPHAIADGPVVSAPGSAPGTFACAMLAAMMPESRRAGRRDARHVRARIRTGSGPDPMRRADRLFQIVQHLRGGPASSRRASWPISSKSPSARSIATSPTCSRPGSRSTARRASATSCARGSTCRR